MIARAVDLAAGLLAPQAGHVAEHGVPRSHLDALAQAGVLGLSMYNPSPPLRAEEIRREVTELLAAADGATWFVSAQHHYPVSQIASSPNQELRDRWLRDLLSGRIVSALAISHLRQPNATVVASRERDRWRIKGSLRWVTGWSLADVIMIGAVTHDNDVVLVLVPWHPADSPGPVTPQDLWSMNATNTVTLDIHDMEVPASMVVKVVDRAAWLEWDSHYHANVNPAVFGVIRATSDFLLTEYPDHQQFAELGAEFSVQCARLRERAYELRDQAALNECLDEKRRLRAAAVDLACQSATACVIASGAGAMRRGSIVGRLVAETFFQVIQGQNAPAREAVGRLLLDRSRLRRP